LIRGSYRATWVHEMGSGLLPRALPMPGARCVTSRRLRWRARLFHSLNNPNHILLLDGSSKNWREGGTKLVCPKVHLIKEFS